MRIAWFSPMPPDRSGIAAYSAELLPWLRPTHEVDVFVDRDPRPGDRALFSAHDFVWMHRRRPYHLTVFQMGNALCHGYMWAYFFRFPGLLVLHDAQLHQSRALWLMKRYEPRYDDYLAEFRATETHAPPEAACLIAAGLGQPAFYQHWPLVRLVVESARLTVVHGGWLRTSLAERYPNATIAAIEMGVADPWAGASVSGDNAGPRAATSADRRTAILARHGIPADAVVVTAFGGITPEKRLGPLVRAVGRLKARLPALHVMLVGDEAGYYDVRPEAAGAGVADRVHITGYIADEELPLYLEAADICSCLRWPTNRETSASWLRCLAAGKPTLVTALAQYATLPDVAVPIDVLDEESALPIALESLAMDAAYRARLAAAARRHWDEHHRIEVMASGYERVLERAASLTPRRPALPAHLRDDGSRLLRAIAQETGVTAELEDMLDRR